MLKNLALAPSQCRHVQNCSAEQAVSTSAQNLSSRDQLATCSDPRRSSLNYPLDRPGSYTLSAGGSRREFRDICPLLCFLAVMATSLLSRVLLVWLCSLITVIAAKLRKESSYGTFCPFSRQSWRTDAMMGFFGGIIG